MIARPVTVAVVIPFYQREAGILTRALRSAFRQDLPDGVALHIVVVDDGSPVSAEAETGEIGVPEPHRLTVLSRPNGGPGAARNHALAFLDPAETPLVAFLDSDDEWDPDHLATALTTIGRRHDFYFCDHVRFERETSWLDESPLARGWRDGARTPAPDPLAASDEAFVLSGDAAFEAFVEEYLSQTSTVVYRFDRHAALRFDTELRSAGEDHMFWLALAHEAGSVVFSRRRNVACGRGVNLCFSAFDWNEPEATARHGNLLLFRIKLQRGFDLPPAAAARTARAVAQDGETYAYLLARNAARGRLPDWALLGRLLRTSPRHVAGLPLRLAPMLSKQRRNALAAREQTETAAP